MRESPPEPRAAATPIRLRIQHVYQLFHTLDPFPFRERDLDAQVEEYVVGWAREVNHRAPLSISISMPGDQASSQNARHIADAFRNYFSSHVEVLGLELRALFRTGRDSLAVGLGVLALTVLAGAGLKGSPPGDFLHRFVEEGLIIVGWVANWKPIEILLFDWWPIARRQALYRRLADARVEAVEEAEPPR